MLLCVSDIIGDTLLIVSYHKVQKCYNVFKIQEHIAGASLTCSRKNTIMLM